MTTISAKIIADSISPDGIRIVTMQLKYPRFIHAELMTHRVFSRNASSSRAVPVNKTIEWIQKDTAMPKHWGKNQKGMQANEECNEELELSHIDQVTTREEAWIIARDNAIAIAQSFHEAGYHKQIVNRLLEPFAHINVVVTSTYWKNFLHLRDHKDAMPEIQMLAQSMKECLDSSPSEVLVPGEWHLPYIRPQEKDFPNETLLKCSVARCARVSYLTFEGKEPIIEKDLELYDKLITSEPLHASPAEHQATPDERVLRVAPYWNHYRQHGNFVGWRQYRKTLKGEFVNEYKTYDPLNDCDRYPWGFVVPE